MFKIQRSSYYAWLKRKPSIQDANNKNLDQKIKIIFNNHKKRYGYRRITNELQDFGETCSKNRVARRMRAIGLYSKTKKKFKITTDSKHKLPVAPNILNREFATTAPNQKWCGDISYI
jgi:putative transposase